MTDSCNRLQEEAIDAVLRYAFNCEHTPVRLYTPLGSAASSRPFVLHSVPHRMLLSRDISVYFSYDAIAAYPLEPHYDTVLQMWAELDDICSVCCSKSRCNRGIIPAGNTVVTGGGSAAQTRTFLIISVSVASRVLLTWTLM